MKFRNTIAVGLLTLAGLAGMYGCSSTPNLETQKRQDALVQTYPQELTEMATAKNNAVELKNLGNWVEYAGYTAASVLSGNSLGTAYTAKSLAREFSNNESGDALSIYTVAVLAAGVDLQKVRDAKAMTLKLHPKYNRTDKAAFTLAVVLADGDLEKVTQAEAVAHEIDSGGYKGEIDLYASALLAAKGSMDKVLAAREIARKFYVGYLTELAGYTLASVFALNDNPAAQSISQTPGTQ